MQRNTDCTRQFGVLPYVRPRFEVPNSAHIQRYACGGIGGRNASRKMAGCRVASDLNDHECEDSALRSRRQSRTLSERKGWTYDERRKHAHAHRVSYVVAHEDGNKERNGCEGVNRRRLDDRFDEGTVAREVEHRTRRAVPVGLDK